MQSILPLSFTISDSVFSLHHREYVYTRLAVGEGFEPPHQVVNSHPAFQFAYPTMKCALMVSIHRPPTLKRRRSTPELRTQETRVVKDQGDLRHTGLVVRPGNDPGGPYGRLGYSQSRLLSGLPHHI